MANRAEDRKFHYIYRITRADGSGKYYIGMHSTDVLEDGYFGSGMLLWKSIKKHGKDKHSKEILQFLPSRKELKAMEKQVVNEEILHDPLCMNLQLGGEGGFKNTDHQRSCTAASALVCRGIPLPERHREKIALSMVGNSNAKNSSRFAGRKHSKETLEKMRKTKNAGSSNSQFGTCWVTNGVAKKIRKEELDEYLDLGYSLGRKTH